MAPKKSFFNFVQTLFKEHQVLCRQMQPVWVCMCNSAKYNALPNLEFDFHGTDSKTKKTFFMPKEAYMMHKQKGNLEMCILLISPWDFAGLGKRNENEEYWILGAQFL